MFLFPTRHDCFFSLLLLLLPHFRTLWLRRCSSTLCLALALSPSDGFGVLPGWKLSLFCWRRSCPSPVATVHPPETISTSIGLSLDGDHREVGSRLDHPSSLSLISLLTVGGCLWVQPGRPEAGSCVLRQFHQASGCCHPCSGAHHPWCAVRFVLSTMLCTVVLPGLIHFSADFSYTHSPPSFWCMCVCMYACVRVWVFFVYKHVYVCTHMYAFMYV